MHLAPSVQFMSKLDYLYEKTLCNALCAHPRAKNDEKYL